MNPPRHHPIKPAVAQLQAYDPHKRPGQVKLDANEHPFALPPAVREAVLQHWRQCPSIAIPIPRPLASGAP